MIGIEALGRNAILSSGSWGALLIILGELGASTYIWRFREHCLKADEKKMQRFGENETITLGIKGTHTPLVGASYTLKVAYLSDWYLSHFRATKARVNAQTRQSHHCCYTRSMYIDEEQSSDL